VLVTSASGFIGSHLVRRLTSTGADVDAVSRRPQLDEVPTWHVADPTNPQACLRPMEIAQRGDRRPAAELYDWQADTPLANGLRKTVARYADNIWTTSAGRPIDEGLR
jgi:dTDP-D-glucose 4,6-dehydratase